MRPRLGYDLVGIYFIENPIIKIFSLTNNCNYKFKRSNCIYGRINKLIIIFNDPMILRSILLYDSLDAYQFGDKIHKRKTFHFSRSAERRFHTLLNK